MRFRPIGLGIAAGALVLAGLAIVSWYQARGRGDSSTQISSYEGTPLGDAAPGFRLQDQSGRTLSLADFRGRVVVLTLLDPYCTDICPIYAHHYKLAYQGLGPDASKVAFLAFNANDEKTAVDDVMAATKKWAMNEMPHWHFLTGSPEELHAVWRAYGMVGSGPPKAGKPEEKQHSPSIFVIDHAGKRRWFFSTNFDGAPTPSALIVKHVKALLAEEQR